MPSTSSTRPCGKPGAEATSSTVLEVTRAASARGCRRWSAPTGTTCSLMRKYSAAWGWETTAAGPALRSVQGAFLFTQGGQYRAM